ncbi:replication factor C subunit 3 isoform X2 [Vigna radiata var. radiata]|uniref:Replication factor C subunit 3 isoform X2 n=1 Tax=Vigna radiata var. radiata TaxID=3916 RepID=A0A3Q0F062_VIGRR|nr:replication factor C subunit 3 isoform X2 [Vigna radiata var. radiata]
MVNGEHNLPKQPNVNVSDHQSMSKNHISPTLRRFRFRSRRKKTTAASPISSLNLRAYDIDGTNSPYYKGLTDHSLAIVNTIPSCAQSHSHTPSSDLLSSPYYKGLTDYSLVIRPWTPHNHPLPFPHNSLSYTPSPYYAGLLTHYTILFHARSIQPSFTTNLPNIKTQPTLKDLMVDPRHVGFATQETDQVGNHTLEELGEKTTVVDQEKPLRENDFDIEMVTEEKALGESVFEQATDEFEGVSKEAIFDRKLMSDDAVVEEKPLGEKSSETSEMDLWKKQEVLPLVSSEAVAVSPESECKEGDVYDYTWAAKYQPMALEEFICNKDIASQLKTMVEGGCGCSHFIFEGPPSVGKRSMIRAMLREVFGSDRVQVEEEYKNFILKGEMVDSVQVRVKKSFHHVEVNLSETNGYEKHVIVDLFKETYGQVIDNSQPCCPENCKAIVLYEAEKLSIESLLYIKWLLEKYEGCNKVFFCCSDESKLQPVKPLCITLRLSSPSTQELATILENIAIAEGIQLPRHLIDTIILRSNNNLRQAIRSLEATCRNRDAVKENDVILTGWEQDILDIAKKVIQEQSPRQLYAIRRKLRSLMIHDVPPDFIYKSLVPELTSLVHHSLRPGIAKLDRDFMSESDEKNTDSTKKNALTYLKVEEFIAKVMSWYKNWSEKDTKL